MAILDFLNLSPSQMAAKMTRKQIQKLVDKNLPDFGKIVKVVFDDGLISVESETKVFEVKTAPIPGYYAEIINNETVSDSLTVWKDDVICNDDQAMEFLSEVISSMGDASHVEQLNNLKNGI